MASKPSLAARARELDKICDGVLALKTQELELFEDDNKDNNYNNNDKVGLGHKSSGIKQSFHGNFGCSEPSGKSFHGGFVGIAPSEPSFHGGFGGKGHAMGKFKTQPITKINHPSPAPARKLLQKSNFPSDFIFGTASAAYQYEGAWRLRGENMWDAFTRDHPENIADYSNGDVAQDFYNRYKEDVKLMKQMGVDAFRFSISWSRIFPTGRKSGGVNDKGVQFYNDLINEIKANDMKPFVTLLHFDVPEPLQKEYGGFLGRRIIEDFRDYAEFCFWKFGDRVKHWITINEPWSFSYSGYALGVSPPGRCTPNLPEHLTQSAAPIRGAIRPNPLQIYGEGDSATEPYTVSHNQLLAHAAAVKIYKTKYQATHHGLIGIALVASWMIPLTETHRDRAAAIRAIDFMFGWFMDPLAYGYYPKTMQQLVGDRLPRFSHEEEQMVKGSFDFIGLNYYTARYIKDVPYHPTKAEISYQTDSHAEWLTEKDGKPIGKQGGSDWLYIYPQGILDLLRYLKNRYHNPLIYITENGVCEKNDGIVKPDSMRIEYHYEHIAYIYKAIRESVNVKGYFAWSFMDNFEWRHGYTVRFGLYHIDYEEDLERSEKVSAMWYSRFLKK